jgi:Protein of unknown function (DUF2690)
MIQHITHRFRYWFISCIVLISVLLTFFSTTGLGAFGGKPFALQTASAFAATNTFPCHKPGGCPTPTPTPIHLTLPPMPMQCFQTPDQQHCDNQDPVAQGCLADAQTKGSTNIYDGKVTVGRVDRRFSPNCQSYWVRTFNYSQNGTITAELVGHYVLTGAGDNLEEYTDMIYMPQPSAPPVVRGSLFLATPQADGPDTNQRTVTATIQ